MSDSDTSNIGITAGASDSEIAGWIAARIEAALAQTDEAVAINVPGGSTPFPIMEELVKAPLPWERLRVWPGDDRIVPEDHSASNTGKIRALFAPLGAEVVSLEGMMAAQPDAAPRFALSWLGMGTDGHIASLFPNTDPRADDPQTLRRLTPDPLPPEAPFDRITLTIPALVNCDAMMFLIRSEEKAALFEAAAAGQNDLPIARVLGAARAPVTCFT